MTRTYLRALALFVFAMMLGCNTLQAQSSMTDTQVMEFIVSENQRGASRSEIVTKLMERGVSIETIRRVRNKYEKQQSKALPGAKNITTQNNNSRLRKPNGEKKEEPKKQPPYKTRNTQYRDDEEQRNDYYSELERFVPDTIDYYMQDDEQEEKKDGKKIFGRNIFNHKNLSFEPNMNIATPADYRLGPGDAVYVDIYGASQKTFESTVSPDGYINLEGYGPVSVNGLTVSQATARLKNTLGRRYQSSQLRVSVGQTKTISVNVFGEVKSPGTYTLSAFATVFHALYMAGGTTEIGSLRSIKVYRHNNLISTVDVYDYILNGKLTGNVKLQSGDVITVQTYDCLVQIAGKVKRPMWYEMKSGESVATLLKYAGGFSGEAYEDNVSVIRKKGGMYSVYSVDKYSRSAFRVADGDSVYVDSTLNRYSNMVEIKGEVNRPGYYQMDGSIATVSQLIEKAGGLTDYALKQRGLMHRRKADRSLEAKSFDVEALMNHEVEDIILKNEDVIFIPSLKDMQEERTVRIEGEVVYPGVYDYIENTSLEDFVLQAGGLKDAASTVKIDVSRRIRNHSAKKADNQIAQWFSFELKDGFVVDGTAGFVLQPFDEVYVRRSPGYIEQEHVSVDGEIAFAGVYTLTKKTQRLSDLIRVAGGLTSEGYAHGARLERVMTYSERLNYQNLMNLIITDSLDLARLQLGDTRPVGISLDKALENPGSEYDLVLRNGDRLIIPQYSNTVSINGQVLYPNTVNYKSGATLSYYINQAGGFNNYAKKSKVFAVNMNGTVTRIRSSRDIEPGTQIFVPSKANKKGLSVSEFIGLGTMGASVAAIIASILK